MIAPSAPTTIRHGALVLAAGASKRLGRSKQLIEIDGEPMLRRVARFALSTQPADCIVVLGHDAVRIGGTLDALAVRALRIENFESGMAASLRAGIAALDPQCAGVLIVLTDQPALTPEHLGSLCAAWRVAPERAVASAYAGVLGVPALLPRAWFADLVALRGDTGARDLLRARRGDVSAIRANELARDVDTLADVQNLEATSPPR